MDEGMVSLFVFSPFNYQEGRVKLKIPLMTHYQLLL